MLLFLLVVQAFCGLGQYMLMLILGWSETLFLMERLFARGVILGSAL